MVETLIVGLGNPGLRYAGNRHNIGFMALTELARANGLVFGKPQKLARIASGSISGVHVLLVLPKTYMNESGRAIGELARFYKLPSESILVVCDDLDLPLGTVRLRGRGSSGGHRGVKSIIRHLGSQAFPRLRLGIGRPPDYMDAAAYVLQDFSTEERGKLQDVLTRATVAIEAWLSDGIELAMTRHNRDA
jgi:PTH1 family peptidyl-tRNA hydrolase